MSIDADTKRLTLNISETELNKRRQGWVKPEIRVKRGVLAKYARTVGSASQGAVTG